MNDDVIFYRDLDPKVEELSNQVRLRAEKYIHLQLKGMNKSSADLFDLFMGLTYVVLCAKYGGRFTQSSYRAFRSSLAELDKMLAEVEPGANAAG